LPQAIMNVFVLNTGRCGSVSFIKACQHITNFTSSHESRGGYLGAEHFRYPENHIEADNRLSWFLGRLDQAYGDRACYVHLLRDPLKTAQSFAARYQRGIIHAYRRKLLMGCPRNADPVQVCMDYCDTVNTNIALFLRDKTQQMTFRCENAAEDFPRFWSLIGARGDLAAACAEWKVAHNATRPRNFWQGLTARLGIRI